MFLSFTIFCCFPDCSSSSLLSLTFFCCCYFSSSSLIPLHVLRCLSRYSSPSPLPVSRSSVALKTLRSRSAVFTLSRHVPYSPPSVSPAAFIYSYLQASPLMCCCLKSLSLSHFTHSSRVCWRGLPKRPGDKYMRDPLRLTSKISCPGGSDKSASSGEE